MTSARQNGCIPQAVGIVGQGKKDCDALDVRMQWKGGLSFSGRCAAIAVGRQREDVRKLGRKKTGGSKHEPQIIELFCLTTIEKR
jgi:hypothetical protein